MSPNDEFRTLRRLFGLGPDRIAAIPDYAPGEGSFAFVLAQRGSDEPVGYDPCRPIEYAVNPEGAPDDWSDLVETAVLGGEAAGRDRVRR